MAEKPKCPRCGYRGGYEAEDGDAYCEEPGCPYALKVLEKDGWPFGKPS